MCKVAKIFLLTAKIIPNFMRALNIFLFSAPKMLGREQSFSAYAPRPD